jgi:hypothetical protein
VWKNACNKVDSYYELSHRMIRLVSTIRQFFVRYCRATQTIARLRSEIVGLVVC